MHTHNFLCVCVPYKVILSLPVSRVTRVAPCSHLKSCQKSCPLMPYCEAWGSPLCTHVPLTEASESCACMLLGRKSPVNALSLKHRLKGWIENQTITLLFIFITPVFIKQLAYDDMQASHPRNYVDGEHV